MELIALNTRAGFTTALLSSVLALQACSFLPSTVRDSAASLHQGELQIAVDAYPMPSISAAYGVTDQWDVGFDIEEAPSLWTRYTYPNQAQGTDVALIAGVFQTRFRSYGNAFSSNYTHEDANGFYIGGIYSHTLASGSKFNVAYRYNSLHYDAFLSDGGDFSDSFLGGDSGSDFLVSDRDLAGISTLTATMSIVVKPQAHFHIGASCLFLQTSRNNRLDSTLCSPVVGVTFFRR
jgi:hypothetical protein